MSFSRKPKIRSSKWSVLYFSNVTHMNFQMWRKLPESMNWCATNAQMSVVKFTSKREILMFKVNNMLEVSVSLDSSKERRICDSEKETGRGEVHGCRHFVWRRLFAERSWSGSGWTGCGKRQLIEVDEKIFDVVVEPRVWSYDFITNRLKLGTI